MVGLYDLIVFRDLCSNLTYSGHLVEHNFNFIIYVYDKLREIKKTRQSETKYVVLFEITQSTVFPIILFCFISFFFIKYSISVCLMEMLL